MKSFEELLSDSRVELDLNGVEISDYEIGERLQSFLNGCKIAEDRHRKKLNKLSFQLNKKALEGCPVEEMIRFYNKRVGSILDDFIF
ncbi:hypothetical protein ES702_06337 [subsurface metagenome]